VWYDDAVAPGWTVADADGRASRTQEFTGSPGDTIVAKAQVGTATDAPTVGADFTVTEPKAPEPKVTVSVSPDEGPPNTSARIRVTGPPGQPVTISVDGKALVNNGKTDVGGSNSQTHIFLGSPGQTIEVEAQVGLSGVGDPKDSAEFVITGSPISGGPHIFISTVSIIRDKRGHGPFVAMPSVMDLTVMIGSITVQGPAPFVKVSGELAEDGTFSVIGSGTVAGFPDVSVQFDGRLTADTLIGEYTMGVAGGLPGGESITYNIEGLLQPRPLPNGEGPGFVAFYSRFNEAQAIGNATLLIDALHPAVTDRYGVHACGGYLTDIVSPDVVIEFIDAAGPEP